MSTHCKIGESPKVSFLIPGSGKGIFDSPVSPVVVDVIPTQDVNLSGEEYAWNFSTAANPRRTLEEMPFRAAGKLTNFKVDALLSTSNINGVDYGNWACSFKDGNGDIVSGSAVGYYPGDVPKLVKLLVPSSDKPPFDFCRIIIKNLNGDELFTATGKCPIIYDVRCSKCPDGHIECETLHYPGYCCIPCVPTANKIDNLSNSVRLLYG